MCPLVCLHSHFFRSEMFELRFVVLDMSQAEESQLRLMEVAAMEPTPVAVAPFAYNILK